MRVAKWERGKRPGTAPRKHEGCTSVSESQRHHCFEERAVVYTDALSEGERCNDTQGEAGPVVADMSTNAGVKSIARFFRNSVEQTVKTTALPYSDLQQKQKRQSSIAGTNSVVGWR